MPMSKGSRINSTRAPERYSAIRHLARFSPTPRLCVLHFTVEWAPEGFASGLGGGRVGVRPADNICGVFASGVGPTLPCVLPDRRGSYPGDKLPKSVALPALSAAGGRPTVW